MSGLFDSGDHEKRGAPVPYEALPTNDPELALAPPALAEQKEAHDQLAFQVEVERKKKDQRRRKAWRFARHSVYLLAAAFVLVHVFKVPQTVYRFVSHRFLPESHRHHRGGHHGGKDHRDHLVNCTVWTKHSSKENSTFSFDLAGLNETNSTLKIVVGGGRQRSEGPLRPVIGDVEYVLVDDDDVKTVGVVVRVEALDDDDEEGYLARVKGWIWKRKHHHHHRRGLEVCTTDDGAGVVVGPHPRHWHHGGHHHSPHGPPPHHPPHGGPPGEPHHPHHPPPPGPPPREPGHPPHHPPPPGPPPHGPPPHPPPPPPARHRRSQFPPGCLKAWKGKGKKGAGMRGERWGSPIAKVTVKVSIPRGLDTALFKSLVSAAGGLNTKFKKGVLDAFDLKRATIVANTVDLSSLSAARAVVISENGPIVGSFNSSKSLTLIAHDADVNATVTLFSNATGTSEDRRDPDNFPTRATIIAKKGAVNASVALISTVSEFDKDLKEGKNGLFNVHASNAGAPASVLVTEQPADARLGLSVVSSRGASVLAEVARAFEGRFSLITSGPEAKSDVKLLDEGRKDPTGGDRERVLEVKNVINGRIVTGNVKWVESGDSERVQEKEDAELGGWEFVDLAALQEELAEEKDDGEAESSGSLLYALGNLVRRDRNERRSGHPAVFHDLVLEGRRQLVREVVESDEKVSSISLVTSNADATLVFP